MGLAQNKEKYYHEHSLKGMYKRVYNQVGDKSSLAPINILVLDDLLNRQTKITA